MINNEINDYEKRFQWSIQKSIKMKAIPYLLKEIFKSRYNIDLDMLERNYCIQFNVVVSENVAWNQRSFARTMFFIQKDLRLLNNNYLLKDGSVSNDSDEEILNAIYEGAVKFFIPFQIMIDILQNYGEEQISWDIFKSEISKKLVLRARSENLKEFEKKERSTHNIYFWEMDDPSINRLVELGRLLGICSFIVLKHIRYVGEFQKGTPISTIDFEGLIELLSEQIPNLDHSTPLTFDEVLELLARRGYNEGVVKDAMLSEVKKIVPFSGRSGEKVCFKIGEDTFYRFRFSKKAFRDGMNERKSF